CLLVLLAAALALGATHRAQACPQGMSDSSHLSCCDGMDQPAMHQPATPHSLDTGIDSRSRLGCASAGHCICRQPLRLAQVTAREVRPAILAPSPLLVWPASLIASGRTPPPRGPPFTGSSDSPGRHTYLATLRLRI